MLDALTPPEYLKEVGEFEPRLNEKTGVLHQKLHSLKRTSGQTRGPLCMLAKNKITADLRLISFQLILLSNTED